jgi:stress response protein SCP2
MPSSAPVLRSGANIELPAHVIADEMDVLISWTPRDDLDLDLGVVAVGADGLVTGDKDFVFFNHPRHPSGAVRHLGQQTHDGKRWDAVRVTPSVAPSHVVSFHITLSGEHDGIGRIEGLTASVVDKERLPVATIDLAGLSAEGSAILLEIYRRAGTWKLRAVCQGWTGGLAAIVNHFGIAVDEDEESELVAGPPPPPSQTAPSPPVPIHPGPAVATPGRVAGDRAASPSTRRGGLFGARKRELQDEIDELRGYLAEVGALDAIGIARLTEQRRSELRMVNEEMDRARRELHSLRQEIVEADDFNLLQSVGIYDFAHPLDDAVTYKERITRIKDQYKDLTRRDRAINAAQGWQVNGSVQQGAKMLKDTSKLMLRAYNAEADNCVRVVRAHSVDSNTKRLDKARDTIAKLGSMMSITIAGDYHQLRIQEIKLTADYHAKVEQEKEAQREERERLRDEQKALAEFNRAREKLTRERDQLQRAIEVAVDGAADAATVETLRQRLAGVDTDLADVEARAANARAGYVYVISNVGAFGPNMVKIGMTRRQDPMDRVRELGDASVPFKFDDHALVFSNDAVGLEAKLHAAFADRRVNRVNLRREFFYVSPADVREKLFALEGEHLLDYKEAAIADEWNRSGRRSSGWSATS